VVLQNVGTAPVRFASAASGASSTRAQQPATSAPAGGSAASAADEAFARVGIAGTSMDTEIKNVRTMRKG
jgi:hypothetical protein